MPVNCAGQAVPIPRLTGGGLLTPGGVCKGGLGAVDL